MSPVQGVRAGPLPWAKIPVRVHVLWTRTPCILQVVYKRRIASCLWCINCLLMVRPTCMTTCRQGQRRCGRAREWGGWGGRAVPVTRAVAIALTWATTDDGQEAYFSKQTCTLHAFWVQPVFKSIHVLLLIFVVDVAQSGHWNIKHRLVTLLFEYCDFAMKQELHINIQFITYKWPKKRYLSEISGSQIHMKLLTTLDCFGRCQIILDHFWYFEPFWTTMTILTTLDHLDRFGPFWTVLDHFECLDHFEPFGSLWKIMDGPKWSKLVQNGTT